MRINVPAVDPVYDVGHTSRHVALPFGRRTGLADVYAPTTAQPLSRLKSVTQAVWLKAQDPKTIAYRAFYPNRPEGIFERAYEHAPILLSDTDRLTQRLATSHADRIARTRAGRVVALGAGGEGFNWIRVGRRMKPANPSGINGSVALTRGEYPAERGVRYQQLAMPLDVSNALSETASDVAVAGPTSVAQTRTRVIHVTEAVTPNSPASSSPGQLLYLLAAVAVVFLIVRAK